MKGKNRNFNHWLTKVRAPYERVFAQDNKRVRYIGIVKNRFVELMNAIAFNLGRLSVLIAENLAA